METAPRTVAVVEDDSSMRKSVERLLNAHGYQTEGYASAEAFLERDLLDDIGCLVLDIHLGSMSGIQLRHRLGDTGAALPVIFITAVDDEALKLEAIQAGCIACLRKPFAGRLLLSAVETAMTRPLDG